MPNLAEIHHTGQYFLLKNMHPTGTHQRKWIVGIKQDYIGQHVCGEKTKGMIINLHMKQRV